FAARALRVRHQPVPDVRDGGGVRVDVLERGEQIDGVVGLDEVAHLTFVQRKGGLGESAHVADPRDDGIGTGEGRGIGGAGGGGRGRRPAGVLRGAGCRRSASAWARASSIAWLRLSVLTISSRTASSGRGPPARCSSNLMMWKPNGVYTTSLTAPGSRANTAVSKAGTIFPCGKTPRSPPLSAEPLSSELLFASVAKSSRARTRLRSPSAFLRAAALTSSEAPVSTFTRMWRARTCSGSVKR